MTTSSITEAEGRRGRRVFTIYKGKCDACGYVVAQSPDRGHVERVLVNHDATYHYGEEQ